MKKKAKAGIKKVKKSIVQHPMLPKSSVGVTPLGDRVLVLPLDKNEAMSKSGIIIPETVDKERPDKGKVVAVGPGKRNDDGKLIPVSVKIGQTVIFSKYGPDEIKIADKEYYVISESNILAIIEEGSN